MQRLAQTYVDHFIAVHLSEMPYGDIYATASAAALVNPKDLATTAVGGTIFKSSALRGLLLGTYTFGQMDQIADYAASAAFILAGIMPLLVVLGLFHYRRASEVAEP